MHDPSADRRVLVIEPFAERAAPRETRPPDGPTLVYRGLSCGPLAETSDCDRTLLDLAILEAGIDAQAEGFDAVCIAAMTDSGLSALRSMLAIPVLSAGRVAMLHALTLGARFSILAPTAATAAALRKTVHASGLAQQCASVRSLDDGEPWRLAPALAAARRCIEDDGADVICLGCVRAGDISIALADTLGVPVVEPGALLTGMAEVLLSLGLSHGGSAYPPPLVPKSDLLRRMMQAGAGNRCRSATASMGEPHPDHH